MKKILFINKLSNLLKVFILIAVLIVSYEYYLSITSENADIHLKNIEKAITYLENNKFKQSHEIDAELENILSSLWTVSDEQLLIDPKVIINTLKFKDREENDPELLEFIRSLIIPPVKPGSEKKLNLTQKKFDYSALGQSLIMDEILGQRRNGFFIEAGGHNGERSSNSLFFEINRGWTGILIEAVPSNFQVLKTKNRNAYMLNACIAREKISISKFRVHDSLTGRANKLGFLNTFRLNNLMDSEVKFGYFPCFPLNTIMKAIGVSHVDFFSLDVEGGELDVVKSINYNKLDIETFCIEVNSESLQVTSYLKKNGYKLVKYVPYDNYYRKIKN